MKHIVYIGLGSNIGQRDDNIRHALELLEEEGTVLVTCSSFYETAPQGFASKHLFLNAAACVFTSLSPMEFLVTTQRVERMLGRISKSYNGVYTDRTIDIDILFFDNAIISTSVLTVPHPRMAERAFVLEPLCEIAPALKHPQTHLTVRQMLAAL